MLNIPNITTNPSFHLPKFFSLSTIACYLRPTSYTRLHKMTNHKFINHLGIFLCMFQHMGARTNNRHITHQYINKLRQFINTRFTNKLTYTCFTRIICCSLKNITLCIYSHRTKFVTPKFTTVFTTTFLFKKNGPRRADFNSNPYYYINKRENSTQEYQ